MNKNQEPSDENVVTEQTLQDFAAGLRELALNCEEVIAKMREKSIKEFTSTNYTSTKRGVLLITRFVSGAAGTVATFKASSLLRVSSEDDSPDVAAGKQIAAEAKEQYRSAKKGRR